ncbi:Uncharacterised protein [Chlamydia trachomatis]|nr:Uncharacterised protein [Chlamydia trachomatis]
MLDEDPGGFRARDDDCANVIFAVGRYDVRPHDPRELGDVDEGDGGDDDDNEADSIARSLQRAAEDENCDGSHRDAGDSHDDVKDAHDEFGERLAHDCSDRADDRAEEEGDEHREQADHHRVTPAVQDAREDVAADVIGAEDVGGARGLPLREDLLGGVGGNDRREEGHEEDEGEDEDRDLRSERHRRDPRET